METGQSLLRKFYNSRQEENEPIAVYGPRLEQLIHAARVRGAVTSEALDIMLRETFFRGLRDERVADITRHELHRCESYLQLFKVARNAEQEIKDREDCLVKTKHRSTVRAID